MELTCGLPPAPPSRQSRKPSALKPRASDRVSAIDPQTMFGEINLPGPIWSVHDTVSAFSLGKLE